MIDSFSGEYRFLSNFYADPHGGPTVEHYFQAAKTLNPDEIEAILRARTPGQAKSMGRKATLRPDWDDIKDGVMLELLRDKFYIKHMRSKLLATGDAELIEGNTWGDTYWGVCNGRGQNKLGKLLMQVRDELKDNG